MSSDPAGWVYAVQEEGTPLVKIGATHQPMSLRLVSLRSQYRVPLTLIGAVPISRYPFVVERRIHSILAPQRIQGEWFYVRLTMAGLQELIAQAVEIVRQEMLLPEHIRAKKRRLARALGCTTDYLVGMNEDEDSEQLAAALALVGA